MNRIKNYHLSSVTNSHLYDSFGTSSINTKRNIIVNEQITNTPYEALYTYYSSKMNNN